MSEVFEVIRAMLLIHFIPRNKTYYYLHCIDRETGTPLIPPSTKGEYLFKFTLRQLEKRDRSPPSKCPTFSIVI